MSSRPFVSEHFADHGDPTAQYNVGLIYDLGRSVPQDYERAKEWYVMAADQGHVDAQARLGVTCRDGMFSAEGDEVVPQDYVAAVDWFGRAALQGHADAQFWLGNMYHYLGDTTRFRFTRATDLNEVRRICRTSYETLVR